MSSSGAFLYEFVSLSVKSLQICRDLTPKSLTDEWAQSEFADGDGGKFKQGEMTTIPSKRLLSTLRLGLIRISDCPCNISLILLAKEVLVYFW